MYKPQADWIGSNSGTIAVDNNWERSNGAYNLHFGNTYSGYGMTFFEYTYNNSGTFDIIQLIISANLEFCGTNGYSIQESGNGLDASINSLSPSSSMANTYFDDPGVPISSGNNHQTDSGSYETYLMFNPNSPGSISVPLKLIAWDWSGVADPGDGGSWQLTSSSKHITSNDVSAPGFPVWTNVITLFGTGYTLSTNIGCQY
jgi:hypothetical protein